MGGFVTPIFAQEVENALDDAVVETENFVDDAAEVVDEVIDESVDVADDTVWETVEILEDEVNFEWVDDFNSLFENEEVQNVLVDLDLTNEEAAWIFWIFAGIGIWLLMVFGIIGFVLRILRIIALWKAFERAGEEWWKALIPVYCTYIQFKLAWMKKWFWCTLIIAVLVWIIAVFTPSYQEVLSGLIVLITWIIRIVMLFVFARKYGWSVFASVLFVIFYPICVLILGLWDYKYEGEEETVVEA